MKTKRKKSPRVRTGPRRQHKQISLKSGLPPESLVHIGQVFLDKTTMDLVTFSAAEFSHHRQISLEEYDKLATSEFNWLKVHGLHEVEIIGNLGKKFKISQLLLEDILNASHRPKMEEDEEFIFLTLRSFFLAENEVVQEQVSFLLGKTILVSFQESDRPIFDPVINRLTGAIGKIRQRGIDYLLYNLIDVIVDQYFNILENMGDQLEELEDKVYENPDTSLIEKIQQIRRNIITMRKSMLPTQETLSMLIKSEPDIIDESDLPYFSDIVDHVNQCIDFINMYRDLSTEIKESYLSNLSYRMNQVMKLLTIITSIFIPLTFIAGIYGMNFANMPELEWKYGYFGVLGLMFAILVGMLIYFRRKRWI